MSIYIGNDLEDRLEALEAENASLRKYNEYRQIVDEIDHLSDLHVDSSFYKQSMKLDNYVKINEWFDSSIGQSTVIQRLNKKRPTLSKSNQTQNSRRYVNFENGSHFICSFNLNNPESTVCITFRLNSMASGNNLLLNGIIGNSIKYVAFYKTHSGLGLLISTAYNGSYLTVANDDSSFIGLDYKFPSAKSDCTILNKWHVISVTWSNNKDLSNSWSNGKKIMTFNTGNTKGTDHCIIGITLVPPSISVLFPLNLSCGVTSCHSCGVTSSRSYISITAIPLNASVYRLIFATAVEWCHDTHALPRLAQIPTLGKQW